MSNSDGAGGKIRQSAVQKNTSNGSTKAVKIAHKSREKSVILAKAREQYALQFPTAYPMEHELWGKELSKNQWRRCSVVHARVRDPSKNIIDLTPVEFDYYIHWLGLDRRLDCWLTIDNIRTIEQGPPEDEVAIHEIEQEAHHDHSGIDEEYLREHEINTKLKTINKIKLGPFLVDTWYFSPYPAPYQNIDTLYICEFCLSFFKHDEELSWHISHCELRHPPGNEIYRDDNLAMFEVDGALSTVYCENLCYLSKLFLDHKSLRLVYIG